MASERASLGPVHRESTPSLVARELRNAIARGELVPGQQLPEADLARRLGVSRGPLREAMQRLTQEGLLLSIRNRGLFVIELDEDSIRDVYLARMTIESAAAARVIERDAAAAVTRLRPIVRQMSRAVSRGRQSAFSDADIEFHRQLVEMSGSVRLNRMHQTLLTETRMCLTGLESAYAVPDRRVVEHQEIVDAIADRDVARATKLLDAHMDDAVRRLTAGAASGSDGGSGTGGEAVATSPRKKPSI